MLGATIIVGKKKIHTWNDWKLKWYKVEVSSPQAKTYTVDVPGMDGYLDLTESLGGIKYNNRAIKLNFDVDGDYYKWATISSNIMNFLHGKVAKIILDTDSSFYYIGRLNLSSTKEEYSYGELELSGDIEPYKYELFSSLEKWKWDSFNFVNGIIRNYKNLKINGKLELNIPGRRKTIYPVLIANTEMKITFNNVSYTIPANKNIQLLDVALKEGDNILTIEGNGTITIDYRGGSL